MKEQKIDFIYRGIRHKFIFTPEESDEWLSFKSFKIVFDIHYDEYENELIVYECFENLDFSQQPFKVVYKKKLN